MLAARERQFSAYPFGGLPNVGDFARDLMQQHTPRVGPARQIKIHCCNAMRTDVGVGSKEVEQIVGRDRSKY